MDWLVIVYFGTFICMLLVVIFAKDPAKKNRDTYRQKAQEQTEYNQDRYQDHAEYNQSQEQTEYSQDSYQQYQKQYQKESQRQQQYQHQQDYQERYQQEQNQHQRSTYDSSGSKMDPDNLFSGMNMKDASVT